MTIAKVSEGGRVVIPAALRDKYGIAVGDTLIWTDQGDGIRLESVRASIRRGQAIMAKYKRPGVSEVDAFIRDKRKEAARGE